MATYDMSEPADGLEWLDDGEPRHPDAYPHGEPWGPDNPAPGSPWSRQESGATCEPGYPKLSHGTEERGRNPVYELYVQYRKGGPRTRIGTVRRQGSLPSMASWHGRGAWDGAQWITGCRTRGDADAAVFARWQERQPT